MKRHERAVSQRRFYDSLNGGNNILISKCILEEHNTIKQQAPWWARREEIEREREETAMRERFYHPVQIIEYKRYRHTFR